MSFRNKINFRLASFTCHGIAKVFQSVKPLPKLTWLMFFTAALIGSISLIIDNLSIFFEYPVVTKIRYHSSEQVDFPTVTICHNSPFMKTDSVDFLIDYLERYSNYSYSIYGNNLTKLEFLNNNLLNNRVLNRFIFFNALNLNESMKKSFSFTPEEMIINCEFHGEPCNYSKLAWYYDYDHGGCYSFNALTSQDESKVVNTGGTRGSLVMDVFAGFEDQVPNIVDSYGFRIIIYNRTDDPFFSYSFEKLSMGTGEELTIIMKRHLIDKIKDPYSECELDMRTANIDSFNSSLYKHFFEKNRTYSQKNCIEYCYEKFCLERCGCVFLEDGVHEVCTNIEQVNCSTKLYFNEFRVNLFGGACNRLCPLECNSQYFSYKTSTETFPTTHFAKQLINKHKYFADIQNITTDHVQQSVSRVRIHYDDIRYETLKEIEMMSIIDVIANMGGTWSLCLGISFLSFFEIIEIGIIFYKEFVHRVLNRFK